MPGSVCERKPVGFVNFLLDRDGVEAMSGMFGLVRMGLRKSAMAMGNQMRRRIAGYDR